MFRKFLGHHAFISILVLTVVAAFARSGDKSKPTQKSIELESHQESHLAQGGNLKVKNFYKAKKLVKDIFQGMEETIYCGCSYRDKLVNHKSCGFVSKHEGPRTHRIEWEHIVPAYDFGRSFKSWREGHTRCVRKSGKSYRGRSCARKVSSRFNQMEADLYNLVPAIGEVNERRSNLPVMNLPDEKLIYGHCPTKVSNQGIEPRNEVKGLIARTYKYMNHAYPGHGIISRKNRKLIEIWADKYPVSENELRRARRIYLVQGNRNPFVDLGEDKL